MSITITADGSHYNSTKVRSQDDIDKAVEEFKRIMSEALLTKTYDYTLTISFEATGFPKPGPMISVVSTD